MYAVFHTGHIVSLRTGEAVNYGILPICRTVGSGEGSSMEKPSALVLTIMSHVRVARYLSGARTFLNS